MRVRVAAEIRAGDQVVRYGHPDGPGQRGTARLILRRRSMLLEERRALGGHREAV